MVGAALYGVRVSLCTADRRRGRCRRWLSVPTARCGRHGVWWSCRDDVAAHCGSSGVLGAPAGSSVEREGAVLTVPQQSNASVDCAAPLGRRQRRVAIVAVSRETTSAWVRVVRRHRSPRGRRDMPRSQSRIRGVRRPSSPSARIGLASGLLHVPDARVVFEGSESVRAVPIAAMAVRAVRRTARCRSARDVDVNACTAGSARLPARPVSLGCWASPGRLRLIALARPLPRSSPGSRGALVLWLARAPGIVLVMPRARQRCTALLLACAALLWVPRARLPALQLSVAPNCPLLVWRRLTRFT
ncbi:hypothetical protein J2S41_006826 [Catenuloplanes atrovinosus]|uniref:Uncharacterized protein n=1 Tax=Catenuloplanes atrovinosus TaxID=137266 RepID=A0AAE4CDB7_9ACTN|nr:hypothetical protein [Catenuloplanes atrovinosus]